MGERPGPIWAWPRPRRSRGFGSIPPTATWCSSRPWGIPTVPTRSAGSSAPGTGAEPGPRSSFGTSAPAPATWPRIRATRGPYTPACGRSLAPRGGSSVAGPAAVSSSRWTGAIPGRRSPGMRACPPASWPTSASRCPRPIPSGSTPSSKRTAAASSAPATAAPPGSASTPT